MAARCYLALSSNLGNRLANLQDALRQLSAAVAIDAISSLYESDPAVPADSPYTYAAMCAGITDLTPADLRALCGRIEWAMGRRPGPQPDLRPLAIDIMTIEGEEPPETALTLPQTRIEERPDVLVPLTEIAPAEMLPDGLSVRQAADRLVGAGIRRIADPEWRDTVAVAPPGQRIGVATAPRVGM